MLGTERHESRRIDNQLRGRSGRQGDPGHSKFFLSLEDDLMRIFGTDKLDGMLTRLGLKENEAIVHPWINKALEKAQQKVEARNFDMRKNILKYDNVMNDQRKVIFDQRVEWMQDDAVAEIVADMRHTAIDDLVAKHVPENAYPEQWDTPGLREEIQRVLGIDLPVDEWAKEEGIADEEIFDRVERRADEHMAGKAAEWGADVIRYIEKSILLQTLDHLWREHLVMLDHLRQVVGLRGYAQRDPLNEYKAEAFSLFEAMSHNLREAVTAQLMRVEVDAAPPPEQQGMLPAMELHKADPMTGEDEMAMAMAGGDMLARQNIVRAMASNAGASLAPAAASGGADNAARPERPVKLGQGRPQRGLPVRFRQEIQALSRTIRLITAERRIGSRDAVRIQAAAQTQAAAFQRISELEARPSAVEVAGRHNGLRAANQTAAACRRRGSASLLSIGAVLGLGLPASAVWGCAFGRTLAVAVGAVRTEGRSLGGAVAVRTGADACGAGCCCATSPFDPNRPPKKPEWLPESVGCDGRFGGSLRSEHAAEDIAHRARSAGGAAMAAVISDSEPRGGEIAGGRRPGCSGGTWMCPLLS